VQNSTPAGLEGQLRRLAKGAGGQECGRELREFLKWANHYHHFIKDYAAVAKPLAVMISPKVKWVWNKTQQQVFDNIKQKVGTSPKTGGRGWSVACCGLWKLLTD